MEPQISISPGTPGRLIVRFPYSAEFVKKIQSIWGRKWHSENKYWTVPDKPGMIDHLKDLFRGERTVPSAALVSQPGPSPKIIEEVRTAIRTRHYSPRTETAYVYWINRFLAGRENPGPSTLGEPEIAAFLSGLAEHEKVSGATQNQALKNIKHRGIINKSTLKNT